MAYSKTFVEKIFGKSSGSVVMRKPDLILTHDNTSSIYKTFSMMGGQRVRYPEQLLVVLDHNAPPTNAKLATQYQAIRDIVKEQGVDKFYDVGRGICHQIMSYHARPGMIIVGSDSHTCTAGAFNAMAAGIDRTESAGIWKKGETWFRVPESLKITLTGKLRNGVYAKDLSLWIIGTLGSDGANYMSIEYHGDGVSSLSMSDRMTIANLASEMGAKNAVFPPDDMLASFFGHESIKGIWADQGAKYSMEMEIDLGLVPPLVAAPHHVDNVIALSEVEGKKLNQGLIGTCTNGRIEDLRVAAGVLKGKMVHPDFQLLIVPASREIYLQAVNEGIISSLVEAGASILSPSCGPCLGTGQGIPADGYRVISTANRNFLGRMGNKMAEIYLASPAAVALSAIKGEIANPAPTGKNDKFVKKEKPESVNTIDLSDNRKSGNVWDYSDINDLNTDQMFSGNLTYNVLSSDADAILPHLFAGFDQNFASNADAGDIIIAGDNFGCGSSREHPSVGLSRLGIKAVIVKSVNRIFYRSCINQGLPLIVNPVAVEAYHRSDRVDIDFRMGSITIGDKEIHFSPLPGQLNEIIEHRGLVNWMKLQ